MLGFEKTATQQGGDGNEAMAAKKAKVVVNGEEIETGDRGGWAKALKAAQDSGTFNGMPVTSPQGKAAMYKSELIVNGTDPATASSKTIQKFGYDADIDQQDQGQQGGQKAGAKKAAGRRGGEDGDRQDGRRQDRGQGDVRDPNRDPRVGHKSRAYERVDRPGGRPGAGEVQDPQSDQRLGHRGSGYETSDRPGGHPGNQGPRETAGAGRGR